MNSNCINDNNNDCDDCDDDDETFKTPTKLKTNFHSNSNQQNKKATKRNICFEW